MHVTHKNNCCFFNENPGDFAQTDFDMYRSRTVVPPSPKLKVTARVAAHSEPGGKKLDCAEGSSGTRFQNTRDKI